MRISYWSSDVCSSDLDPCVVAWLLKPELFGGRECHVAVATASELTLGQTVVDWWGVAKRRPNCLVVDRIDADGFYDQIGRAACRERVCQYVKISVVAVS